MPPRSSNELPTQTHIIIGATRGIGLELTRQLLMHSSSSQNLVIATARSLKSASKLLLLADGVNGHNLKILECDVSDEGSIRGFAEGVGRLIGEDGWGSGVIDSAVLNAGVLEYPGRVSEISFSAFAHHLHTNTIGPLLTAQHLLKLSSPPTQEDSSLPASTSSSSIPIHIKTLVFISSDSGSTQNFLSYEDGFGAYAASKAALNQGLRHLAAELYRKSKEDAPVVLAIHPGEVLTDMAANVELGWEVEGSIGVEESVEGVLRVVREKGKGGTDEGGWVIGEREGRKMEKGEATFWTWEGVRYPW